MSIESHSLERRHLGIVFSRDVGVGLAGDGVHAALERPDAPPRSRSRSPRAGRRPAPRSSSDRARASSFARPRRIRAERPRRASSASSSGHGPVSSLYPSARAQAASSPSSAVPTRARAPRRSPEPRPRDAVGRVPAVDADRRARRRRRRPTASSQVGLARLALPVEVVLDGVRLVDAAFLDRDQRSSSSSSISRISVTSRQRTLAAWSRGQARSRLDAEADSTKGGRRDATRGADRQRRCGTSSSSSRVSCSSTSCASGCGLTGTNVGCDTSSCGACTVLVDGESVKSCTMLGVQADGRRSRPSRASRRTGAAPRPAGLPRPPRAAVRLLHAGDGDGGRRRDRARRGDERGRDPRRARGQPLPLHRVPQHRRGRRGAAGSAS